MSPKSRLRSLKARFKRILSDREPRGNNEFNDSASSSSSDKKTLSSPSRFLTKRSFSTNSSANRKLRKALSPVLTDASSSSSSADSIRGSQRVRRKSKKEYSSGSELSSESQSRIPAKTLKKLRLIGLEGRLKLPLNETSQISPSSKIFASDTQQSSENDRDHAGSRRHVWSSTLSPSTSTEPPSPAVPQYSFSLNDSSAPSSPGRAEKIRFSGELRTSRSPYEPTGPSIGDSVGNPKALTHVSSAKVKRIQSAFLDEERGVWRCRNCDWIYPNPNPSARHRREHKKHCGEMLHVQEWLKVVNPEEKDVLYPVADVSDEGSVPEIVDLRGEVGKAPLLPNLAKEEAVHKALFDYNRVESCEDMAVKDPVDEVEGNGDGDGGERKLVDLVDVVQDSLEESKANGELDDRGSKEEDSGNMVQYPGDEVEGDGDVDGGERKVVDLEDVVKDLVEDSNGEIDDGGFKEEDSSNVLEDPADEFEENGVAPDSESKPVNSVNVIDGPVDKAEGDGGDDDGYSKPVDSDDVVMDHVNEVEGNEQVDHGDSKPVDSDVVVRDPVDDAEGNGQVDDGDSKPVELENLVEDSFDEVVVEDPVEICTEADVCDSKQVDFGNAVQGSVDEAAEIGEVDNIESKHAISEVEDNGQVYLGAVKPIDLENEFQDAIHGTEGVDQVDDGESTPVDSENVAEDVVDEAERNGPRNSSFNESAERSLLLSRSSSSSSSSSSSRDGKSDSDETTRKVNQNVKPPDSEFQDSHYHLSNGKFAAAEVKTSPTVPETVKSWKSRNAVRDEALESTADEGASSTSFADEPKMVITSTITTETTLRSPPQTEPMTTSILNGNGVAGSAIKKEEFKHRQTFWADITKSDILEGNFKLPSSRTSSPNQRPSANINSVHTSNNLPAPYPSRQDNEAEDEIVTQTVTRYTQASNSVTETVSRYTQANNSDSHHEASTSKSHTTSKASSSSDGSVYEYDLERVIHEQKTHDIMCPVCGSCITQRVILRKRKRYHPPDDPKRPRLPLPPVTETTAAPAEPDEQSGWGCLACLSLFFRRASRDEERDFKEVPSCLQIVFPTFPWGPSVIDTAEEIDEPETVVRPTPEPESSVRVDEIKLEEEGCTSYLNIFNRPSPPDSSRPVETGTNIGELLNRSPPPVLKEGNWFSYLKIFQRSSALGSSRPALPSSNDNTSEPVVDEPGAPPTPTPPKFFEPEKEDSTVGSEISVVPENIQPGQVPERSREVKGENVPPDVPGKVSVEIEIEESLLPTSLEPHISISESASPVQTEKVREFTPPAKASENDRCNCFEIFRPAFSWHSLKLNTEQVISPVIPDPPVQDPPIILEPAPEIPHQDRQCFPLFWFSRRTSEQPEAENPPPPRYTQSLEDKSGPSTTVPSPVPSPDTPDSPRECLPFIRSAFYAKTSSAPSVSEDSQPLSEAVQREPWKDFKPWEQTTTLGLYVRQFYDPLPPIRLPTDSLRPVHYIPSSPTESVRRPPSDPLPSIPLQTTAYPPTILYVPSSPREPTQHPVPDHSPQLFGQPNAEPVTAVEDTGERSTGSCVDFLLPTFPLGSSVQDEERSSMNCLDLVIPAFPWGPAVEEPQRYTAPTEEPPRPEPPRSMPEVRTDLQENVQPEEQPKPSEPPAKEEENRHIKVSNRFVGHFVREEVIVTSDHIEVIKNTTHIESLLDSENRILTLEEIKDKPSMGTPSSSRVETAGPSNASGVLAQRVAEGVQSLDQQSPRPIGTPHAEADQAPVYQGDSCSCLPFDLPTLSWSRQGHLSEKGRTGNLLRVPEAVPTVPQPPGGRPRPDPYKGTTEDRLREPLLQSHEIQPSEDLGSSSAGRIDLYVDIPDSTPSAIPDAPRAELDILKSVVYGGLDTTLISLGVVSSATGGDASTLTVIAMGVANVLFGFVTLLGTITAMYKTDLVKFKQLVGPSYRVNGFLAAFAYLLFGLLPPVTYGFSFRDKTNRDWKMGATCFVAIVSLVLLGWAKARVTAQKPFMVITTLITTGFVAAITSYKVGDYVSRLLQELGFDSV
ncbi:hypothetical protein R1flu_002505 [Riccia fluitans]|uniref:C2H2-type domain-containing protein n=1 Tax=Riccia fluitans TaxID=41844 RepID=A0ABD1Y6H6_9MARC